MTAAVASPGATEVLAEIRTLRKRLPDVTGVLLATIDGLLVAHDTEGLETDALAAMSAAQLGLGQQLAAMAAQGDLFEAVARCSGGSLAIFAAGPGAVLTVLASVDLNVGRLHHEALLKIKDTIEDILITLGTQYHLIRPLTNRGGQGLFIYIALTKSRANLAMARLQLRRVEEELQM